MKTALTIAFLIALIMYVIKSVKTKQVAERARVKAEKLKMQSTPVDPENLQFEAEYYINNQTLCVIKAKKGFDLYSRLGKTGIPRKEGNYEAVNAGEALAKALSDMELSVI